MSLAVNTGGADSIGVGGRRVLETRGPRSDTFVARVDPAITAMAHGRRTSGVGAGHARWGRQGEAMRYVDEAFG